MSTINIDKLNKILYLVEKPARYTGGELNMTEKTDAEIKFALCFPDVYEIGMSHLGSRILYNILNKREDTICERAYAPWPDMEAKMRENDIPMFSLETKRRLRDFDIIGFSLLYEMCYTNILTMLDLSGIPFKSAERGEDVPIIVCGGPCACNPEPIANIVDAAIIGDGEEIMNELVEVYKQMKNNGATKKEILHAWSKLRGIYIPSFYEPEYDENGMYRGLKKLVDDAPDIIKRNAIKNLDEAEYIGKPIVPHMQIVHDRIALEIFRGCTRGCRFCQAGYIYRPIRERKMSTVMEQAKNLISCTGYDEVSLFSLSSGDYSQIHELVPEIINTFESKRVSVSFPSLRIDSFLKDELENIQEVRKAGLTFAPEAGTQRLRDVINKGVTEEDLLRSAKDAFESGWNGVKLYFMIGLPTETYDDIQGIADLARKVSMLYYSIPKEKRGKGLRITVSASTFVPKPFTAFQWEPQIRMDEILEKQKFLKNALKGIRGVEFAYHTSEVSVLEAVFSRGDRKLSDVLIGAYRRGTRFDSWAEHFKKEAWDESFAECGVDPDFYAHRRRDIDEVLPWGHIDMLVKQQYLKREYAQALKACVTRDCRKGCNGCFGEDYEDYCKI